MCNNKILIKVSSIAYAFSPGQKSKDHMLLPNILGIKAHTVVPYLP